MKITSLLQEGITAASSPDNATSSAPNFGRSDKFLEEKEETVEESTTSGSVATVASPVGGMQRRGKGSMFQGIKTSSKYPNSKPVQEGEEFGSFAGLKDWREWNVMIFNNFYRGKYADYGPRIYSVVASSPEEAREVILNNTDYVLQDLLSRKLQSGKRVLPRGSALPIEDKRVGGVEKIKPGSLTTSGFKKMLTPEGPMNLKFSGGKIIASEDHQHVVQGSDLKTVAKADLGNNSMNLPSGYGDVVQPQKLKDVDEAFIAPALSAANSNAEHERTKKRKIITKNGKPVGEVGLDNEASPGNGPWYMTSYATGHDYGGYQSYEEALAELKHCLKQGVAEAGDTAKGQEKLARVHHRAANRVTSKQADKDPAYARKAQQTQDRAWDRLAVKEQGVAEGFDDIVKGVKRVVKGKPSKSERKTHYANKTIGAAQAHGSTTDPVEQEYLKKEMFKNANRFDKVKNVGNKGVTEAGEWTKLPNGNWRNMHTGAQQSTPPKTKKPRRTMGLNASLEQHADDKMKELGHKFKGGDIEEGFADTIKHKMAVRSRAKNIKNIRKKEDEKSVFEKDPEAMREFERSGGYEAGIDVMGWQVGWAAAKHAQGDTMKEAFQKLYYGGGSSFPFSQKAFKLAWVAYNKHHGPEAAIEEAQLDEVNPHNYDSDEDYYNALKAPARQRSSTPPTRGVNMDDEAYFREIFRKNKLAQQKKEREADHDRLATGTNEAEELDEKSKSQAQFRTMAAVAHNPKFAKKVGISQKVGKEFHSADKNADYESLPKKVDEAEFTEDKLASDLYKDLQIFKKGADKEIGSKAKDKDISSKAKDKDIVAKEDCWDGYEQIGMKKKNGKTVPNCVPKK